LTVLNREASRLPFNAQLQLLDLRRTSNRRRARSRRPTGGKGMKRATFQVAVADEVWRMRLVELLQGAGYDVHTDPEVPDSDFALLEKRTLEQQQAGWQRTIRSNRSIATAVGMLMERHRLSAEHAFDALRRQARDERTQLVRLAERIVDGGALLFAPGPPPS
jgi:hypothetical protein